MDAQSAVVVFLGELVRRESEERLSVLLAWMLEKV